MKRPDEVHRIYHRSDDEVLQQSDLKLASFIENKGSFVGRFTQLGDPFAADWDAATTFARKIVPDYASVASQSVETQTLNAMVLKGDNLFQSLLLYVRLAFPDNAEVLRIFGQQKYEAARNSHVKLPGLLQSAYTQASKPVYKSALMAKGIKEEEIEMLQTMSTGIVNQDKIQQKAMTDRTIDANNRIIALNTVWEKMSLVCQCAKLVFQNDAVRYNMFLLGEGDNQAEKPEDPPVKSDNI